MGTYLAEVGAGSLCARGYRRLLEENAESGLQQRKHMIVRRARLSNAQKVLSRNVAPLLITERIQNSPIFFH